MFEIILSQGKLAFLLWILPLSLDFATGPAKLAVRHLMKPFLRQNLQVVLVIWNPHSVHVSLFAYVTFAGDASQIRFSQESASA